MLKKYNIHKTRKINFRLFSQQLNSIVNSIYDKLSISKRSKVSDKKSALNCILCNLLYSRSSRKYIRYSRKRGYYSSIPSYSKMSFQSYDIIIPLIDSLETLGIIESVKGFYNICKKKGRLSKFRPTKKFDRLVTNVNLSDVIETHHERPIILKSRKTKKPLSYPLNNNIRIMINQLMLYNERRQSWEIAIDSLEQEEINDHKAFLRHNTISEIKPGCKVVLKQPFVYRVFNDSFKMGGRFYNGIETNMSKTLRDKILINGEPTVELDYSSLHIRMLYNEIGEDYKQDAYSQVADGDSNMRSVYKIVALCSINARSIDSTIGAIRKAICKYGFKNHFSDLKDPQIKKLIEDWKIAHPKLEQFFCNDKGLKLQNKDSKIASAVIQEFLDSNEIILCNHDSFIVKKTLQKKLMKVMKAKYKEVLGFEPEVK